MQAIIKAILPFSIRGASPHSLYWLTGFAQGLLSSPQESPAKPTQLCELFPPLLAQAPSLENEYTPDPPNHTLSLIDACVPYDRWNSSRRVERIILSDRASIDVNLFLDTISKHPDTDTRRRNIAIEDVLREFVSSISADTANRFFIQACESRAIAVHPILMVFGKDLTPQTIETSLVLCREYSIETCVRIIEHWAELGRRESHLLLTPKSIAISLTISTQAGADHCFVITGLLNLHYSRLPSVRCEDQECRCHNYICDLDDCARHGYIDMVALLLKEDPAKAGRFLDQGVHGNNPGVIHLVSEYRDMLESKHIEKAMDTAVLLAYPYMVDMLMDLFPQDLSTDLYIKIFNDSCERGAHESVEIVLARYGRALLFESGFTFDHNKVKRWVIVRRLLNATYRDKLREQFPGWDMD